MQTEPDDEDREVPDPTYEPDDTRCSVTGHGGTGALKSFPGPQDAWNPANFAVVQQFTKTADPAGNNSIATGTSIALLEG